MEWLFIIGVLWAVSSYLYHTSTFEPELDNLEKEFKHRIDVFNGKIEHNTKPSSTNSKQTIDKPELQFFVSDRTPTFNSQPFYPNQFMSAKDKQTYLQSDEWKTLRNQIFTRDNHTCQSCGSQSSLNCHHIFYDRLGAENLEDLTTLCTTCHTALHKRLGYDRTTIYNITKDKS